MLKAISLILGAGVCGWIAYIAFIVRPVVLFSWHPIAFALAYLLATPSAIHAMNDRKSESNHGKRVGYVQWHAIMQTITVILMTIGFSAIYLNKENNNRPHFTTLHSWIGCSALFLYYSSYIMSMLKTFGGKVNWQWKDTLHRITGVVSFLTSGIALMCGFYSGGWGRSNFGSQGQLIGCILIGIVHILTVLRCLLPVHGIKKD